jgi:hypothetical protein
VTSTTASTALKSRTPSVCGLVVTLRSQGFDISQSLEGRKENSPIPLSGPRSVLAITRTLRSFCTLPMISTAWLSWRCASCESKRKISVSCICDSMPCTSDPHCGLSLSFCEGVVLFFQTYAVQENANLTSGVDCCLLATDLAHFAQDADGLVGELLEVRGGDAGGCFGHDLFFGW